LGFFSSSNREDTFKFKENNSNSNSNSNLKSVSPESSFKMSDTVGLGRNNENNNNNNNDDRSSYFVAGFMEYDPKGAAQRVHRVQAQVSAKVSRSKNTPWFHF